MVDHLQELKTVLQTLGLPVTGQVRLLEDDCTRIAILAKAFASARRAVQAEAGDGLTIEQVALLAELDRRLDEVCRQACVPLSSELALRQSADWQQVRGTAREALRRFGWTQELPPHEVLVSDHDLSGRTVRSRRDGRI